MKELGLMVGDAAKHFDTYPNMIWRMLSGERRVQLDEIISWSQFLQLPLAVTVEKFGFNVPPTTVQVIGAVRSNGRVSILPPDRQERIEAPVSAGATMVALVIDAPQSNLAIWDGSYLYYEPSEIVRGDAFGRLSVCELGDQQAPVVGVLDRASIGKGKVRVFGGDETIETKQLISATPVKWQRAG